MDLWLFRLQLTFFPAESSGGRPRSKAFAAARKAGFAMGVVYLFFA
jgi:hypothetical protein